MKNRSEESLDAVKESPMLSFGLNVRWWRLNDSIDVNLPLRRRFDRDIGGGRRFWSRFRCAVLRAEDQRRIHLHVNFVGL